MEHKHRHTARKYGNVLADKDDSYFNPNYSLYDPKIEFDRFDEIGSGVFSNVLKARQKGFDQFLALKINECLDYDRELAILQKLDNEHIIKLLHYRKVRGEAPEFYFELMETKFTEIYLSLSYKEIVHYLKQMLKALKYCHGMGIIHGDIKPDNMVVNTDEKKLKLIDFGSAQWYQPPTADPDSESLNFEGSERYAAPEFFNVNSQFIDYGVDIWSVGVVLLDMLHVIKEDSDKNVVLSKAEHLEYIRKWCEEKLFISLPEFIASADINSENGNEYDYLSNLAEYVEKSLHELHCKRSWRFIPLLANMLNITIEFRCTAVEAIKYVKKIEKFSDFLFSKK